jgi:hypothetical protein
MVYMMKNIRPNRMETSSEAPRETLPIPRTSSFSKKQETVKVKEYKQKMGYVQAQPHTHFRLKHESDRDKLIKLIESVNDVVGPIIAKYEYGRKYNADIILRRKGDSEKTEPIGKIHLLLFDRPKRYDINSYYIHLHFFQFINDTLFDRVKEIVMKFFDELKPSSESYTSTRKNSSRRLNKNKLNRTNKSNHSQIPISSLPSLPKIDDSQPL